MVTIILPVSRRLLLTLLVQVPNSTEHLFDKLGTFCFGVVVIRLLVEAIEELSSDTQLLDKVDFCMTLVHLLQTNNVRVIQLAHNEDFFTELLEAFRRVNQAKVQALDSVLVACCSVGDEANKTGDSGS